MSKYNIQVTWDDGTITEQWVMANSEAHAVAIHICQTSCGFYPESVKVAKDDRYETHTLTHSGNNPNCEWCTR